MQAACSPPPRGRVERGSAVQRSRAQAERASTCSAAALRGTCVMYQNASRAAARAVCGWGAHMQASSSIGHRMCCKGWKQPAHAPVSAHNCIQMERIDAARRRVLPVVPLYCQLTICTTSRLELVEVVEFLHGSYAWGPRLQRSMEVGMPSVEAPHGGGGEGCASKG